MDGLPVWTKQSVLEYDYVMTRTRPNPLHEYASINADTDFPGDRAMEIALDVLGPASYMTLTDSLTPTQKGRAAAVASQILTCFVSDRAMTPIDLRLSMLTSFIRIAAESCGYRSYEHHLPVLIHLFDACGLSEYERGRVSDAIVNGGLTEAMAPLVYLVR